VFSLRTDGIRFEEESRRLGAGEEREGGGGAEEERAGSRMSRGGESRKRISELKGRKKCRIAAAFCIRKLATSGTQIGRHGIFSSW